MNNPAAMPHFQKGKELLYAFVFSCPGADEEDAGYPAAGVTGTRNADSTFGDASIN